MSSTGASSGSKGKSSTISRAAKVGLQFPVRRVNKSLKEGKYAARIYTAASLYLTAVLEYLASEVLELASNEAKDSKKKRIEPRHLQQAVRKDKDFKQLLSNVTIPDAGVLPKFHQNLLPKSSADRQKEASPAT